MSFNVYNKETNTLTPIAHSTPSNDYIYYSMEEQFTGKYWIDGKKIYRKILQADKKELRNIDVSSLNIDTIIKHEAVLSDDGNGWFGTTAVSGKLYCYYDTRNQIVVGRYGFLCANHYIEYTKTTDSSISIDK